jgi:hypothetical protein
LPRKIIRNQPISLTNNDDIVIGQTHFKVAGLVAGSLQITNIDATQTYRKYYLTIADSKKLSDTIGASAANFSLTVA